MPPHRQPATSQKVKRFPSVDAVLTDVGDCAPLAEAEPRYSKSFWRSRWSVAATSTIAWLTPRRMCPDVPRKVGLDRGSIGTAAEDVSDPCRPSEA
jgi:hypothetical protein